MGYCTRFTLSTNVYEDDLVKDIENLCDGYFSIVAPSYTNGIWVESDQKVKWYNHVKDMKNLSNKYPTVEFKLDGVGEDQGDVWYKLFLGGKMKVVKPTLVWPSEAEVNKQEWV